MPWPDACSDNTLTAQPPPCTHHRRSTCPVVSSSLVADRPVIFSAKSGGRVTLLIMELGQLGHIRILASGPDGTASIDFDPSQRAYLIKQLEGDASPTD